MNSSDDLTTTKGVNQALTQAIFDYVNRVVANCLTEMEREREQAEQVPRPILRWSFVHSLHDETHQRLFTDYFADEMRP